jgi:hypothetical protein
MYELDVLVREMMEGYVYTWNRGNVGAYHPQRRLCCPS